MADLARALRKLREQLAPGVGYEEYAAMVRHVSATYHRIRASRLRLGCAVGVGVPLERALNKYAEAANAWGRCLATAGCEARAIEPKVQRDWRVAGDYLEEAGA